MLKPVTLYQVPLAAVPTESGKDRSEMSQARAQRLGRAMENVLAPKPAPQPDPEPEAFALEPLVGRPWAPRLTALNERPRSGIFAKATVHSREAALRDGLEIRRMGIIPGSIDPDAQSCLADEKSTWRVGDQPWPGVYVVGHAHPRRWHLEQRRCWADLIATARARAAIYGAPTRLPRLGPDAHDIAISRTGTERLVERELRHRGDLA